MYTRCRACNAESNPIFTGVLLHERVQYLECDSCGYVQTEQPSWLDRAYEHSINASDTGIMARNITNAKIVLATLLMQRQMHGKIVDCAGGYGILVRLLRDYGVDAYWSDRYCENLVARGFEYEGEPADLVTAFEAFEHFVEPAEELDRLLSIAPNVLLSTEIIADPAPPQDEWWYYGIEHGQHIGFFRVRTLKRLAEQRGKHFATNGSSYHLISQRPINPRVWRLLIKSRTAVSFWARRLLKSKTLADHSFVIAGR